jgi:hypothetical protein
MNQNEIYYRVLNKLLNLRMKKKYNYQLVFLLNPIQYLHNKELNTDYYMIDEIVSVNLKSPITMARYDRLSDDLRECLNDISPIVEGINYKKINKVILKIKQPILSGTLIGKD